MTLSSYLKSGHGKRLDGFLKAALRDFSAFPNEVRLEAVRAIRRMAQGEMPDIAKPMTGLGSGVIELAIRHRGNAFRAVLALQIDTSIWVIHAFQKKSKSGTAPPRHEIDLIKDRLKRLKEDLRWTTTTVR